jgi:hypothetical protein
MMKKVRKRDRPITTWFGGICCVPMEFRKKENTMTILVKEVIIMRMDGNTDNTVRSNSNFMLLEIS